uniref:Uncharacterized protein n=1 Tax=Citrobacter freundii TaxID=546 RepID=A0A7T8TIW4_CITFR|nr:hypothetical protein JJE75_00650 [Citrobacter freundii]
MPFTLAVQVVTGDDYRKLIRRRKASQEKNDDVHTRTYRPFSCGGESRYVIFLRKTSRRYVSRIRNGYRLKKGSFFLNLSGLFFSVPASAAGRPAAEAGRVTEF